nr:retrotransposon Orf1 [Tanacetum cinerariifolium]
MPPKPDLSFTGLDEFVNKLVVENYKAKSSEEEPKVVRKNDDALIIEVRVSDNKEKDMSHPKIEKKTIRPSIAKIKFVKSKQQEKIARKTVKQVEQHRQNTHNLRGTQRNWNNMMSQKLGSNFEMFNKACYVCGSFDHLQYDCNYHQKQFQNQRMVKPVWNNAQSMNHHKFAKKTHPCAKKNMVPRAVLITSGLVSINTARKNASKIAVLVNTARQVNAVHSKTIVNTARSMSYLSKTSHLTVKRPIHKNTSFKNSNVNQRVTTVKGIINAMIIVKIAMAYTYYYLLKVNAAGHTLTTDEAVQKELGDRLVRATTAASSLEAEQDTSNINKTQSKATPNDPSSQGTKSVGGPRCQEAIGDTTAQTRFESVSKHSNDSLLTREKKKTTQQNKIKSLKKRVKKIEKRNRSRTHKLKKLYKVGLTARVESSGDEESLGKDASKQRRRIDAIDQDEDITLVKEIVMQEQEEAGKSTTTTIPKQQSQEKSKRIMIEEPIKPKKKDQIRLDEEAAKRAFERVNTFEDYRTELMERKEKRAGEELIQESIKKQNMEDDKERAELKQLIEIIPDIEEVEIDAIRLAIKSPRIVD